VNLTDEQAALVRDGSNRIVSSCPGSGKTRTVVSKILACVEAVRDTPRRICCITYTNAATNEIAGRLLECGSTNDEDYCDVNTIHSFCLNNIIRPYGHLITELAGGFEIVAPESEWFEAAAEEVSKRFKLPAWAKERFANIQRRLDGHYIVPQGLTSEAVTMFSKLVRDNGYLTFADIVYYACKIGLTHQYVFRAISSRFAWIIVDEFQDTSELQVELLKRIHAAGRTKFFLVGDPNQSIFGFAGARPDLMETISSAIGAKDDIGLSANYRCSSLIVDVAERLCPRIPRMRSVGKHKDFGFAPVHVRATSSESAILGSFLPEVRRRGISYGETAILAPWWTSLFSLARVLRSRGIPVLGPGARPYKRSLEFAQFAESAAAYVCCRSAESAVVAQRALFFLLLRLNDEPNWRVFSYQGKRLLCLLLGVADGLRGEDNRALAWLRSFSTETARLLREEGLISELSKVVLTASVELMINGIRQNVSDADEMTIDDLGIFARPEECVQLMTMHGAKGREFDAVAVVDFHDNKVPHFTADAAGIREARRLTYVAATRARKLLMFVSDTSNYRNQPSRFAGAEGMKLD
jgi:DNA helicase II / ATP-dependent DNA helicase PcrA